ncbi:MAG: hypothetical protein NTY04_02380 [Candidatus Staskawiczbacteria bacterium]|nr:hypothetical protein [Candidatus Staskawiczbacteria bacterium]
MNIEQKTKLILALLVLFFGVSSIVLFFYYQAYFFFSLTGFSILILLMAIMESYLRIQHNIDQKIMNLYSLNIGNKQTEFNKEIVDLLEKILNKPGPDNTEIIKRTDLILDELKEKNKSPELLKRSEESKKLIEELKQLVDSKFFNNRIAQAKLYAVLEEILVKFSDLKQNQTQI